MGRYSQFFEPENEEELPENMPIEIRSAPEAPTSTPEIESPAFTYIDGTNVSDSDNDGTAPLGEPDSPATATIPHSIASRPAPALKSRYSGHAPFNDMVRRDWQRAIAADPDAFDALLYIPSDAEPVDLDDDGQPVEPSFTEIGNNQKTLTYGDPAPVAILDCPDERAGLNAMDNDGDQDGGVDDVLLLRISPPLEAIETGEDDDGNPHPAARAFVPVGSILEWNESLSEGNTVRSWWYVHRIFTYGTASVGSVYYCIPARNFEGSPEATQ
ncbi:phage tail protein (plasmid) [Serratia sp. JSRIV002]|uniref:phage tail protein n=1 Tax=Serratia sp. JSRIV002 TaxID=2831894 RepID=UPI001CBED119|nr:phage tail protein [Serratia sp. JSRIV002]UAN54751.1 phage tail protein [Serratia sp. JSRIV002]